jgi:hypothetical protein
MMSLATRKLTLLKPLDEAAQREFFGDGLPGRLSYETAPGTDVPADRALLSKCCHGATAKWRGDERF